MIKCTTVVIAVLIAVANGDHATYTIPPGETVATPYSKPIFSTYQPDSSQVYAAQATASANVFDKPYVKGAAFDRIINVWLENTDYDKAIGQPDLAYLTTQGITLTNYYAMTHTSLPNYLASAAGSYFGLDDDRFITLPPNVSSIADILEDGGISWGEYQQAMPYTGYQGFEWLNEKTQANDYVRKHNPLIFMESVTNNADRLANIKNFTLFDEDYKNHQLPQWSFITPNMTDDGHDTTIDFAGKWVGRWLTPKLNDSYFTNRTIIVLTFDETEDYTIPNNVLAIVLGDIPDELRNTTDNTFYDHYSLISTVEANWGLHNLGRGDCGANVFDFVAKKVGYTNTFQHNQSDYYNESIIGYLSDKVLPIPSPNLTCKGVSGKGVLPSIIEMWSSNESSNGNTTIATGPSTTESSNTASRLTGLGLIAGLTVILASIY